jgi:RHS repeat-associated protein
VANHVNPVQSITYGYSALGRFTLITSSVQSVSSVVEYSYLPGTDLLSGWSSPSGFAVTRAFEAHRDLLTAVSNRYNGATVSAFDYINDALSRRTQRIDSGRAGPPDPPITNRFAYNPRSELTSATMGTNAYGYAYDPIGNRELERVNLNTNFYAANALNQYTAVSNGVAWAPEYDADGNLLKLRNWTLQWDAENRLVSASNATEIIRYQHDYMGRRILRETAGVTNRFDYDGWALIRERTYTQTHTLTNTYFWGLDLSGELQASGTICGLWARVGEDGPLYYTYDGNGNVSDLVDASGTVRGHYEYAPFGGITAKTGDLAASNPFRFSTKRQDEATGLPYYGYRDLYTVWGRWLNRDPIGEEGGMNLYPFLRNAAPNAIDPLGLHVYAVDGTWSHKLTSVTSNTRQFYNNTTEIKYYWHGPKSGVTGSDAGEIIKNVNLQICKDFCKAKHECKTIKINMVGWSRETVIALEVGDRLNSVGCCCYYDGDGWPGDQSGGCSSLRRTSLIEVNWMGLFDAVRMTAEPWNTAFTPNVRNGYHARKTKWQLIFPTADTGGIQGWFWRFDGSKTTHSDIGVDRSNNTAYHSIVSSAIASGVEVTP